MKQYEYAEAELRDALEVYVDAIKSGEFPLETTNAKGLAAVTLTSRQNI